MHATLQKFGVDGIWHFTDRTNIDSIVRNNRLLFLSELKHKTINIPTPGGNKWSHDADENKGVHSYVHLAFLDEHPMLYAAKKDNRIKDPVWLKAFHYTQRHVPFAPLKTKSDDELGCARV